MWWESAFWALSAAAVALVLASAAAWDAAIRRVPDSHWVAAVAIGCPLSAVALSASVPAASAALYLISALALGAYMLSERAPGTVALPFGLSLSAAAALSGGWVLMLPSVSFCLLLLAYHAGVLRGGADAKALMSIALAIPADPRVDGLPLVWGASSMVPPCLSVLACAASLTAVPMIIVGIRNAARGAFGRGMMTEYRMSTERARSSFVWTLEDAPGGSVVRTPPSESAEPLDRLEAAGFRDVLVTPMVPFVAFIAAGFAARMAVGDPLSALLRERSRVADGFRIMSVPAPRCYRHRI